MHQCLNGSGFKHLDHISKGLTQTSASMHVVPFQRQKDHSFFCPECDSNSANPLAACLNNYAGLQKK